MFQFGGFPSWHYVFMSGSQILHLRGFPIRISADRSLFAAPRSFSQLVTSFFGSWCQGILLMLFLAWTSFFLVLCFFLAFLAWVSQIIVFGCLSLWKDLCALSPSLAYIAVFLPYFFLERPSNLLKNLFSIICSFLLLIRFSMNIF